MTIVGGVKAMMALLLFTAACGLVEGTAIVNNRTLSGQTNPNFTPPTSVTLCYLAPTDVDDLGFSFWHNKARIRANARLTSAFPAATFTSKWFPNFGQKSGKTTELMQRIQVDQCNVIISVSISNYFGVDIKTIAGQYPNISFSHFSRSEIWSSDSTRPPNLAAFGMDIEQGWYIIGAAAGAQAKRCVGFVYSVGRLGLSVNALRRGMVRHTPSATNVPLYAIELGSFYNPVGEEILGNMFAEKGCDVVIGWSDTRKIPEAVKERSSIGEEIGFFSVGYASDTATNTGDTVLVSLYANLEEAFVNYSTAYMNRQYPHDRLVGVGVSADGGLIVADPSPQANPAVQTAINSAAQRVADPSDNILCGPMIDASNSSNDLSAQFAGGCVNHPNRDAFPYLEQGVSDLGTYEPPDRCYNGTYYSYDNMTFRLSCIPCPAGNFSDQNAQPSCKPCPSPLTSNAGANSCFLVEEDSFPAWAIAVIVVVAVLLLAAIAAVVVVSSRRGGSRIRDVAAAPRGESISFAMLGIDRGQSDAAWRQSLEAVCDVYDAMGRIVEEAGARHNVYAFVSIGDVYMLASSSANELYEAISDIYLASKNPEFPKGVVLRVVLHHGSPTVVPIASKRDRGTTSRVNYVGPVIDALRSVWGSKRTERILVTSSFVAETFSLVNKVTPFVKISCSKTESVEVAAVTDLPKQKEATNPLNGETANGTNLELDDIGPKGDGAASGGESTHGSEDGTEEDIDVSDMMATGSILSKEELVLLRDFASTVLQSFIRVLAFQHQIEVVTAISSKLHIGRPNVPPNMNMKHKRSYNILKKPVKNIATQVVSTLEETELQMLLDDLCEGRDRKGSLSALETQGGAMTDGPSSTSTADKYA